MRRNKVRLSSRSRKGLAGLTMLVASGMLLLAAACGGGDSDSDGNGQTGVNNALTAYAECLSQNGVTLNLPSARGTGMPTTRPSGNFPSGRPTVRRSGGPSGGPGGGPSGGPSGGPGGGPGGMRGGDLGRPAGVDDATWQKAQEACRSVLPSGGPVGGFQSGGPGGGPGGGASTAYRNCLSDHGVTATGRIQDLNTADPKTAAALQACAALRPTGAASPTR
jgi:hypothetical protein